MAHSSVDDVQLKNASFKLDVEDNIVELSRKLCSIKGSLQKSCPLDVPFQKNEIQCLKKKITMLKRSVKHLQHSKHNSKSQFTELKKTHAYEIDNKYLVITSLQKRDRMKIIKEMKASNEIIICSFCGNMYARLVEFFCHLSTNHVFNQRKLPNTKTLLEQRNNIDAVVSSPILSDFKTEIKDEIEIVENELQLQVTGNHDYRFQDVYNLKISPDEIFDDQDCLYSKTRDNILNCSKNLEHKPTLKRQYSKSFSKKHNLRTHIEKKFFKSSICSKSYTQRTNLMMHMRYHTGEKPFKCEICLESFLSKDHLSSHMNYHTGDKPFKCEICLKLFSKNYNLVMHMRCHTMEKPFKCNICLKSYSHKHSLTMHMRYHTGEKPFKCEICSKLFFQSYHLISHKRCHTMEKPFKCDICLKSYTQKQNLTVHMRYHKGEKPFKCEICSKLFFQNYHLISHMRRHMEEKPFKCEICPKSYLHKHNLIVHMRCHTGEKPFKCEICSKSFSGKCLLTKHKRCHTREPLKCRGELDKTG